MHIQINLYITLHYIVILQIQDICKNSGIE